MQKDRNSSILIRVSLLTTFLCLIIMAYTSNQTYFSWRNYQKARELSAVQVVTQYFSDALKNFMFERGRMNVVLSTERPISDQNRDFLNQRRKAADEAFESGFLTIAEFFPDEADLLRREYASIDRLRRKLDAEALESRTARDGNARALWFSGCTDYIDTVIKKIAVIRELSHNDILIFNCFDVIVDSLHFRSIVGNESSVITSAIASGRKLDDDFYMEITTMRGESLQLWSELETAIEHVGSEPLTMALEDVRKQYHRGLRAEQDRLLKLAHEGQLYEGAAKELANLSVPALDSIFRISEEAIHEIKRENQAIVHKALNGLFWGFSQLLAGILLVIIVPRYYKKQFVRPLNDIIQILEDIGEGKTDCRIPHVDRTDEIGKLAFGAKALKYSIIEEQSIKLELEQTVSKLEQLSVRDP